MFGFSDMCVCVYVCVCIYEYISAYYHMQNKHKHNKWQQLGLLLKWSSYNQSGQKLSFSIYSGKLGFQWSDIMGSLS